MKYALVGYGRMGRAIEAHARARGHERVAVFDAPPRGSASRGRFDAGALAGAQVAFEFTEPAAAPGNLAELLEAGVGVVCGTTGWRMDDALRRSVDRSPAGLVIAPNFSVGVNLFIRVVSEAARLFGGLGLHEPAIEEVHHRGKLDAPSGTARRLAAVVLERDPRYSLIQEGHPSGRLAEGALQVVGLRAGREPGIHRVIFDGEQDTVTLEHRARGREGFAQGAVLAAEWLAGRRGLHRFEEVLDEMLERANSRP